MTLEDALAGGLVADEARQAVEAALDELAALRREVAFLRATLDDVLGAAGLYWWWVDVHTLEYHASDNAFTGLGYEPDEFGPQQTFAVYHPDDVALIHEAIEFCRTHPGEVFRTLARSRHKDGTYHWFLAAASCLCDPTTGEVDRAVGVSLNVQELKDTQAALEEANGRLARFAAVVSHDVRAPLQALGTTLHELRRAADESASSEAARLAADACEQSRYALDLVDAVLEWSVLSEAGVRFEAVELTAVVAEVRRALEATASEAGTRLEVGDLPVVTGDRRQLGRLLQNLIANAIRFRGEDPPLIRIAAERDAERDEWIVSVTDNGIGIEEWELERIFLPLQRGLGAAATRGFGIGLAECRAIAERHGGRLWAESESSRGATFRLALPDRAAADAV